MSLTHSRGLSGYRQISLVCSYVAYFEAGEPHFNITVI